MSSFWWSVDDEPVEIFFSLCRNGRWAEWEGERVGIRFDYLEYEDIGIGISDLESLDEDVSNMLLQVLNLETT